MELPVVVEDGGGEEREIKSAKVSRICRMWKMSSLGRVEKTACAI